MTNVDLVKQLESAQLALVRCMVKAEVMLAHPSHDNTHLLNEIVALVQREIPIGETINVERVREGTTATAEETVVEGAVLRSEAPAEVAGTQDVSVGLTGLGGSVSGGRLS